MLYFGSAGEARRWQALRQELTHGLIAQLTHHPRCDLLCPDQTGELQRVGVYEADSAYRRDGVWVWEDYKPARAEGIDRHALWKMRHFELQTGIKVSIVS